jgi:hypothetical protein
LRKLVNAQKRGRVRTFYFICTKITRVIINKFIKYNKKLKTKEYIIIIIIIIIIIVIIIIMIVVIIKSNKN